MKSALLFSYFAIPLSATEDNSTDSGDNSTDPEDNIPEPAESFTQTQVLSGNRESNLDYFHNKYLSHVKILH